MVQCGATLQESWTFVTLTLQEKEEIFKVMLHIDHKGKLSL